MAKRKEAGAQDARESDTRSKAEETGVPPIIRADERYFSPPRFCAWIERHWPDVSERSQAKRFGISRMALRNYKFGGWSPQFETLMRMAARVRASVWDWTDC